MKIENGRMRVSLLALAVQGALLAMCSVSAHADDEEVTALTNPTNTMEIGASNTSRTSAKFGEYTGLNKAGGDVVGNINARGGDAYGENTGTRRWSVVGTDLGLTSRAINATLSNQGQWDIGVGYDALRHNLSDTYQTPYAASMGGNSFVLPGTFGLVSTTAVGTTPVGTDGLSAAQLAAFHPVDISTNRTNASVTAGVNLDSQWSIKFDFNHLSQSGAKLMGFGSMASGTIAGEVVSILPNPTNYKTDTLSLALNWVGDKGHMTTSYFGSFFRDGYDRVDFQTFVGASSMQTMSTAPSNNLHQLNLNGGYVFTPTTKLAGGLSYGRNTQNDAYVYDSYSMVAPPPQASLNGLVKTIHADLKLSDQTTRDLALSAGVKFDERKNETASNFYYYNALDGAANHQAYVPNTPYSNRKAQFELAGDYRVDRNQHVRLAYNRENVKRWCDQYAVGGLGAYPVGATQTGVNTYPAGADCVVAPHSKEDKLGATYQLRANEDVNMNLGYSYSKRTTESDPNAITAMLGLNGNPNLTAPVTTLIMGLNAGDFQGFYPYFDASRKEQMLKAGLNWQTSQKLSLGLGGKYTDDKYDSLYGVKKGYSWSLNLDATYGYSETGSISTYLTQQRRQRDMTDLQRSTSLAATTASATAISIPSGATWSDTLTDQDTTVGIGAKQGGLMGSKLELAGDLTYSLGKTGYVTQLNYATTTTGGLTCSDSHILSCGAVPEINNRLIQFKVVGRYQLDKSSKVALGYLFQQLRSTDYYYNGLQYGSTANTMLPTNQQAPSYSVNVITASYLLTF